MDLNICMTGLCLSQFPPAHGGRKAERGYFIPVNFLFDYMSGQGKVWILNKKREAYLIYHSFPRMKIIWFMNDTSHVVFVSFSSLFLQKVVAQVLNFGPLISNSVNDTFMGFPSGIDSTWCNLFIERKFLTYHNFHKYYFCCWKCISIIIHQRWLFMMSSVY